MAKSANETNQTPSVRQKQKWPRKVLLAVFGTLHFIRSIELLYERIERLWELLKSWLTDL